MEHENNTENKQTVQLSGGMNVTIHYGEDMPSLQDRMEEIIASYQTNSAKI